jgi:RimJ/RimL family protein N-acetyltransferase
VTKTPIYLFFCLDEAEHVNRALSSDYSWSIWRPSRFPNLPAGLPGAHLKLRFLFRWILNWFYIFKGDTCGAIIIWQKEQVVHYSGFTSGYWRFLFLCEPDLQIGDTWTDPSYRGRGLAQFGLNTAIAINRRVERRFWYVVEEGNGPSIRVVNKAGFRLYGTGTWEKPYGIKLFGSFVINDSPIQFHSVVDERSTYA